MWRAPAWHPTTNWQDKLTLFGAKEVADTARSRKAEETTLLQNGGKKDTTKGHRIMKKYEMDSNKERTKLLHGWAGRMARADTDTEASRALRTRGLQ